MILEKNARKQIIRGISEREPAKHINPVNFIGIDPDVEKPGFAVYNKKTKLLEECCCLKFFDVLKALHAYDRLFMEYGIPYIVKIEGGWLEGNNNWHGGGDNWRKRQRISKNVGSNHEAGKKIVAMCIEYDFPFEVVKPKSAIFAFTPYFERVTGWRKPTNADARSAARYVYGF